jgi:hypothetical protein
MLVVGVLVGATWLATGGASAAVTQSAGEQVTTFKSQIQINRNGSIDVTETIAYDFGGAEHHGIYRYIPNQAAYNGKKPHPGNFLQVAPVTDVSVSSPSGAPADVDIKQSGNNLFLQIGDANQYVSGTQTYVIRYHVTGVFAVSAQKVAMNWDVVGDGWTVPIDSTTATVSAPVDITQAGCVTGGYGVTTACDQKTTTGSTATFSQGAIPVGSGLTISAIVPKGTVQHAGPILKELWSVQRAFLLNAGTLIGGLVVLLGSIGTIAMLLWRNARDVRYAGSVVDAAFGNDSGAEQKVGIRDREAHPVEFVPPDNIRPGHMGTLWDEEANPLDVSAMIIDLAVRGYLRIDEIEAPTPGFSHNSGDYDFVALKPADESLLHAEQVLLQGLFRDGQQVRLSELKTHFASRLQLVEGALYDDAVSAGWFPTRPDRVRALWHGYGLGALVVGGGLAFLAIRYTRLGVIGAVLPLFGLLLLAFGNRFPHRSPKGTALVGRVRGFKELFDVGEGERQRFAESKDIFSKYLPYAIVFGMADKWAATFESLGLSPQEMGVGVWYTSPFGYNPIAFGYAMSSFSTLTTGSIAAALPSTAGSGFGGFSGGGFSGGGFGGGGGGSW